MRKTIRLAALTALAATTVLALTSVASAAVSNTATARLSVPVKKNFGTVTAFRTVRLQGGDYQWNTLLANLDQPGATARPLRQIRLRSGAYRWKDYVKTDRFRSDLSYLQCSYLDELATPGGPAKLCRQIVGLPPFWNHRYKAMFRFGSTLRRLK